MKRPSSKALLGNAACLLVLVWLYGGDLWDGLRARSADVAAFPAPPPVVWPACVLAATLGVLGVVLWGLGRGRDEGFKGYRLPPILLVCALFADLVLAEGQMPLRPADVSALTLRQLQDGARALSDGKRVPADPARLRPLLEGLEPPPYLVRGGRAPGWSLQVRRDCEGPVREAPGLEVGTFIYCVAPDRQLAWITLVALPWGERFGAPGILSVEGQPYVGVVQPPSDPAADEGFSSAFPSGEQGAPAPFPASLDAGAGGGIPAPTP